MKYNFNDFIKRYKARLVILRFSQIHRIDYTKIFVLTIKYKSLRIFLVITTILEIILIYIDIINAYLESIFDQNKQPIYMKIPQECPTGWKRLICKIPKSLYGLKQARKLWNKTIIKLFQKIGFNLTNVDTCIFTIK